jgi:hypothetical protein
VLFDGALSPVRFDGGSCGIAAISSDFEEHAAEFLCNPDCVAEREGFEPSVQLRGAVRADVCVSCRESGALTREWTNPGVIQLGKSVRFPVRAKGEWVAILWLKVVTLEAAKRSKWLALTACLAGSPK